MTAKVKVSIGGITTLSIGFAKTKADIDNRAGAIAVDIRDALTRAQRLNTILAAMTTNELVALGYDELTKSEVSVLKSAIGDLNQLASVFQGLATRTPAYDYMTFAKQLTGVN